MGKKLTTGKVERVSTMTIESTENPFKNISVRKLTNIDTGLFTSLCRLGTSEERICHVFQLSRREYWEMRTLLC